MFLLYACGIVCIVHVSVVDVVVPMDSNIGKRCNGRISINKETVPAE
jgi:hypothetical protein